MEEQNKNLLKTGTTTVGMMCKDGIVMAADKRATMGHIIANKKEEKIHQISDNIAVTIAGTVSDAQLIIKLIRAQLKLEEIKRGRKPHVKEAASLLANIVYSNIRKFSTIPGVTHFILAGNDIHGFHLYEVYLDGSVEQHDDYVSSGSGSPMVWGYLENSYKKGMPIEQGVQLAVKAINSAIQKDSASGSGIDIVKITKQGFEKILQKEIQNKITM